jgi:hypothetical protein
MLDAQPQLFAFERTAVDGRSRILCVHNVSGRGQRYTTPDLRVRGPLTDLVSDATVHPEPGGVLDVGIEPYGVRWLRTAA